MDFFSVTNVVIVSLLQIGVIVFGVLACGIARKVLEDPALPTLTTLMLNQGVFLLAIPLIWVSIVLWPGRKQNASEGKKVVAFYSGILILVFLFLLVGYAAVQPWIFVDWQLGDSHNSSGNSE